MTELHSYLVRRKKPKVPHLSDGRDTLGAMASTGGLPDPCHVVESADQPSICLMGTNVRDRRRSAGTDNAILGEAIVEGYRCSAARPHPVTTEINITNYPCQVADRRRLRVAPGRGRPPQLTLARYPGRSGHK